MYVITHTHTPHLLLAYLSFFVYLFIIVYFFFVVFIYCCPEGTKPRQRITYSSAKQNVAAKAEEKGLKIDKKMEVTDPKDASEKDLEDKLKAPTEAEKNAPAFVRPNVKRLSEASPMFALLANVNRKPGDPAPAPNPLLKKIVLPPAGAYG